MDRRHAGRWVALAVLATLTVSGRGAAQTSPTKDAGEKERGALYEEGLALARAARWSDAAERFRKVVAIRSSPKALLALATAEEQSRHLAIAWRTYQKALTDSQAAGESDDATLAQQGLRELDRRVPRVRLVLSGGAGTPHATIDGDPALVGQPVEVDPGPHTIVVSADGVPAVSTSLTVAEGERRDVAITLASPPAPEPASQALPSTPAPGTSAAPPTPQTTSPDAGSSRSQIPWTLVALGATGVAVAGVGAYLDLHGLAEHDALASCTRCTQQDVDNAKRDMWTGTILLWTGAAALATAAVLYVVRSRTPHPAAATFLTVTPGRASWGLGGWF